MFTFEVDGQYPILCNTSGQKTVYLLSPFNPTHTKLTDYDGNGAFAQVNCFEWLATHNIQEVFHCSDANVMRHAGELLLNNTCFYFKPPFVFTIGKVNRMLSNYLAENFAIFRDCTFLELQDASIVQFAERHYIHEYIPITFPLKFSHYTNISYFMAPASRRLYVGDFEQSRSEVS